MLAAKQIRDQGGMIVVAALQLVGSLSQCVPAVDTLAKLPRLG